MRLRPQPGKAAARAAGRGEPQGTRRQKRKGNETFSILEGKRDPETTRTLNFVAANGLQDLADPGRASAMTHCTSILSRPLDSPSLSSLRLD